MIDQVKIQRAVAEISKIGSPVRVTGYNRDAALDALRYMGRIVEARIRELENGAPAKIYREAGQEMDADTPRDRLPAPKTETPEARLARLSDEREEKVRRAKARVDARNLLKENEGRLRGMVEKIDRAVSMYDSLEIRGTKIGDIYYHDLESLRRQGAFEESLCDQLIRHAIPNVPTIVRDFVKADVLAEMVAKATEAARGAGDLKHVA